VDVDATQIRQIVMNLVINASEAIGEQSGVIAVSTGCARCSRDYLRDLWLDEQLPEGLYVTLEVADTGCGMDRDTLARIFDPFFTTKFTGRGLGMAAVLGIVRGHRGTIKVSSEPGRGSTFKLFLPASEQLPLVPRTVGEEPAWQGRGAALLVDDEESVLAIGAEMLQVLGFEVVTASDGREALERYRERRPDLVILDLTMPHLDGEQTFRELRQIDPGVRVIMTSGYNEMEVTQKFAGKRLAGFIQKPYTLETLRAALRKAL
jgi:CheY-like chemotaxis protein